MSAAKTAEGLAALLRTYWERQLLGAEETPEDRAEEPGPAPLPPGGTVR